MIFFLLLLLSCSSIQAMNINDLEKFLINKPVSDLLAANQFLTEQLEAEQENNKFSTSTSDCYANNVTLDPTTATSFDNLMNDFMIPTENDSTPKEIDNSDAEKVLSQSFISIGLQSTKKEKFNKKINAKRIGSKREYMYECQECCHVSDSYISASNHFTICHLKPNCHIFSPSNPPLGDHFYRCNFPGCDANVPFKDLLKHKMNHVNAAECPYPDCKKSYKSKSAISTHIVKSHNNFLYQCPECNKILKDEYIFMQHCKEHTPIICPICQKKLKLESLDSHLTGQHKVSDKDAKKELNKARKQIKKNGTINEYLALYSRKNY